jgi:hypothetical protein
MTGEAYVERDAHANAKRNATVSQQLQIRIHGDAACPTSINLAGLHGDWLLVTRFRLAEAGAERSNTQVAK